MADTKKSNNGLARHVRYGVYGLYIGFVLSRAGFADFGEVHQMFTFTDFNLFLTFCGGVGVSAMAYWSLLRMRGITGNKYHSGTIAGGLVFGVGWAITGACPTLALVMIGGGQIAAIATLIGVLLGTWVYPKIHARFFGWDSGVCGL